MDEIRATVPAPGSAPGPGTCGFGELFRLGVGLVAVRRPLPELAALAEDRNLVGALVEGLEREDYAGWESDRRVRVMAGVRADRALADRLLATLLQPLGADDSV